MKLINLQSIFFPDLLSDRSMNYSDILLEFRSFSFSLFLFSFILLVSFKIILKCLYLPNPIFIVLALSILINLPFHTNIRNEYLSKVILNLSAFINLILTTLILFFTGGSASCFSFLYLFIIIFFYSRITLNTSLNFASLSLIIYIILYFLTLSSNLNTSSSLFQFNNSALTIFSGINMILLFAVPIILHLLFGSWKDSLIYIRDKLAFQLKFNKFIYFEQKTPDQEIFSCLFKNLKEMYGCFFLSIMRYDVHTSKLIKQFRMNSNIKYLNFFTSLKDRLEIPINENPAFLKSLYCSNFIRYNSSLELYANLFNVESDAVKFFSEYGNFYSFSLISEQKYNEPLIFFMGFKGEIDRFDLNQIKYLLEAITKVMHSNKLNKINSTIEEENESNPSDIYENVTSCK